MDLETKDSERERRERDAGSGREAAEGRPLVEGRDVKTAYRRWAPVYSLLATPTIPGRKGAARRVNRLGGGLILEAGVGTGSALPLYDRHLEIVGVDLSHDMLVRANERIARDGLANVRAVYEMDLTELAFPDGAFDGLVCMFTITAVPDPGGVMAEFARVVRPGGTVIVASHFKAEKGVWKLTDGLLSPFAKRLGWNPSMEIDRVMDVPGLALVERKELPPAGLVTMLVFERTAETG